MRFFFGFFLLGTALLFFQVTSIYAQIPRAISYQGVLTNPDGTLIKDGNHILTLKLYPTATGGSVLYTESDNVTVVRGIFNVIIGSATEIPSSLTFDQAYFLGVAVDGGAELFPRTALSAVPYALYAAHAGTADAVAKDAKGVVTSINELDGSIRVVGAGATTVSIAGSTLTISSPPSGSGTGFKLPYSDSAANGNKSIFNIGNTGSSGNAISGIAANGSGISGMTSSAIFGDGGVSYNGVAGFSNGGSNNFAGVLGKGSGIAVGVMGVSASGDGIYATSTSGRAGFFQTSNATRTLEVLNSGAGEAIRGVSGSVGVYGISPTGIGVTGETQSALGVGVVARCAGTAALGTALQIDNGAIKLSGTTRAAFVQTATVANIWGGFSGNSCTEINNPLCNGDSTAMVFITHTAPASASLPSYTSWWHIVYYDTSRQKWQIYEPGSPGIGVGDQFFVFILKR